MIRFSDVTHAYQRGPGVFDINLQIEPGELVFLIGPTGAGKSTLLKLINLELLPQKGDVEVNGYLTRKTRRARIPYLRRTLGMVFQDFRLLPDRSTYDNVAVPLYLLGLSRREIRRRVDSALDEVGLSERAHHHPDELSGGEQQRAAIARAVVNNPAVILADEPTGNLDMSASHEILNLLTFLAEENGSTVIISTHDYSLMSKKKGRLIEVDQGRLVE